MDELNIALLPPKLQDIVEIFQFAEGREKLEILLEYAKDLPALPPHLVEQTDKMEQVHECQTPFFLLSEVRDNQVTFYYDVPMEAPTVRGYASILAQGVEGASPEAVLQIPANFYFLMGLNHIISPLRLRGVEAVLARMKRQMTEYLTSMKN